MADETRSQNQNQQVSSKRTWEQIGAENKLKDQPQLKQTTPSLSNSTGTYNPSTKVYTNKQGQGFSYATAPQGSTVLNPLTSALTSQINQPKPPTGQSGGTYNKSTGVYISPSGQGFSYATAPKTSSTSNTISSQLNQPKQNEIRALSTTDTGYVKPYTLNKLEPFFSPSSYKKGVVGFFGDVYSSFSKAGEFGFKGSETEQFEKRQGIIENVAGKEKYKDVAPYLKMTQGLGYEEFFKSKVNPIIEQREKEYSSLYSKKQKQAEEEYNIAKSKISSGSDYETTLKEYQTKVSKINKELNSFEFPNMKTDRLGQPISKRPDFLNSNLPTQLQTTVYFSPKSETKSIIDKTISGDFKLLQEGYKEIGKTLKIQETGENIGENILTLAPFTVIPVSRVSNVGKLSFGDDMRIRENVNQLGEKGFIFNEVRFNAETQTSIIKGSKSSGGLKQEVELVVPKIINQEGSFIAPYGKYNLKTTGVISPDLIGSQKPIILNSYQSGSLGSKGLSLQTGEEGLYATIGKGTLMPELETSGFVYAEKNFMKQFDTVKSYHGTTNLYDLKILSEGLKSGKSTGVSQRFNDLKLNEVYTTPSKEWANSWANMASYGKGKEVGKPLVLEINMPRETFQKSLIKRGIEKGGAEEFTFKSIEPKYINKLGEYKFTPEMPKNFKQDMFTQFERNIKFKEGEYTSNAFMGVTKSLGKGFDTQIGEFEGYLTRSGKISKIEVNPSKDFGSWKATKEGVLIDTNLKDITFTRVTGKPNIERDFYIKSGKNELGLKSFQESKTPTEFIYKETTQQFKQELKPNIKLDTGFKIQGQSLTSGSALITKSKSLGSFSMSSSLDINQNKLSPRFFSGLSTRDLSSFSQSSALITPQATKQSQVQAQTFKLDLGLKQLQQQKINMGSFNFNPNMNMDFGYGGGGFAFPSFSFSLGANYLISKPKKKTKRKKQKIRPSFTAEVFNIRGSMPKQGSYGVSPFNLRAIPKSFKNPLNINF